MTRREIELETMEQFPIGCRVKFAPSFGSGLAAHEDRLGTVQRYSIGGDGIDGVSSKSCLVVHWDGNKNPCVAGHRTHFIKVSD